MNVLEVLNDDVLLSIAEALVSADTTDLLPLIQSSRRLYSLASHMLLWCPTITLGQEGDKHHEDKLQCFSDFALCAQRIVHLRCLQVEFVNLSDKSNPQEVSQKSFTILQELLSKASGLRCLFMEPLPDYTSLNYESYRTTIYGLLNHVFELENFQELGLNLNTCFIPGILTLLCSAHWRGPLKSLIIREYNPYDLYEMDFWAYQPDVKDFEFDPISGLKNIATTLEELSLRLGTRVIIQFGLGKVDLPLVYPSLRTLDITSTNWELDIPIERLIETYPNLRMLGITHWLMDDEDSDKEPACHTELPLWRKTKNMGARKSLDRLSGTLAHLYSLGLKYPIHCESLCVRHIGAKNEHILEALCRLYQPSNLHLGYMYPKGQLSLQESLVACGKNLKTLEVDFCLRGECETMNIRSILSASLGKTSVKCVSIRIFLVKKFLSKIKENLDEWLKSVTTKVFGISDSETEEIRKTTQTETLLVSVWNNDGEMLTFSLFMDLEGHKFDGIPKTFDGCRNHYLGPFAGRNLLCDNEGMYFR